MLTNFLQDSTDILKENSNYENRNRYWTVLKYIFLRVFFSIPTTKFLNREMTITIKKKETIFIN